jgi:gas vesicle protein
MARSNTNGQSAGTITKIAMVAAAAGAVTALLTTPKSGKEMREDIKLKAQKSKDTVSKQAQSMKKNVQSTTDDMRGKAHDAVDAATGTIHDAADRVSDTASAKVDDAADKTKEVSNHIDAEMKRRNK